MHQITQANHNMLWSKAITVVKGISLLGYYTWVEQQGTTLEDFDRRRCQDFWNGLLDLVPVWDTMIEQFNQA